MQESHHSLRPGTILSNYKIIRVLGEGGFGITYLAEDTSLGLEVVIKEYFPNEFAMRSGDSTITVKSKSIDDFSKGLQRFKEEAQTLAKFSHPSIVKILGYFEANDTAYFVMEYEEGTDLSHYLKEKGTPLKQEEILSIMMPILEGLKEVHKHNYLHRDIKPGNILLRANHSPVLIDFGASKLALGEVSKSVTSMLTEGYAPLEQYSTDVRHLGPFTDLYAVGAVIYKMITGKVPPSAQTRSYELLQEENDPFEPLMTLSLSGYDNNFLKAVDRTLSMKAKERPQNVQELQADIAGELVRKEKRVDPENNKKDSAHKNKKSNSGLLIVLAIMIVVAGGTLGYLLLNKQNTSADPRIVQEKTIEVSQKSEQAVIEAKKKSEEVARQVEEKEKEAKKIVEEIMKKMEEEKEAIATKVIPAPAASAIPVWNKTKAEQLIYKKLRDYGNIRKYGFDWMADKYPNMRLKHNIIGFYDFPYSEGRHIVAIASSAPERNFEAHAFAPKLSFFEFKVRDNEWTLNDSYINAIEFGSWGRAPEEKDIQVVELGQDKFGFLFNSSWTGQGYFTEYKNMYVLGGQVVKNIFSEAISSNDSGAQEPPRTNWRATFEFDKKGTPLYSIILYRTGLEDGSQIDEKVVYKFNGNKYVLQKVGNKPLQPNKQKGPIFYIQVGSFNKTPSSRFLSLIKKNGFSYNYDNKKLLLGPYKDRISAEKALIRAKSKINKFAFIIQGTSVVTKTDLKKTIVMIINGFKNKDEIVLNKLIHSRYGFSVIYLIGSQGIISETSSKIDFSIPMPSHFPYDYRFKIKNDVQFNPIEVKRSPKFDFDAEKWSRLGLYYTDAGNDDFLTNIISWSKLDNISGLGPEFINKLLFFQNKSYRIVYFDVDENELVFYVTFIDNKWYLTLIDRYSSDI